RKRHTRSKRDWSSDVCSSDLLIHEEKFVHTVKKASKGELTTAEGEVYGIGTEDTPIFPNMHEASAMLVGGTLTAVDLVMEGHARSEEHTSELQSRFDLVCRLL